MTRPAESALPRDPSLKFERHFWKNGLTRIAGIDEAGRGALAGPVYAAAVVLPADARRLRALKGVRDSKLMSPVARSRAAPCIRAVAAAWGVGSASAREIDSLGIVAATRLAAMRAIAALASAPQALLTDFLLFPASDLPQVALVKGDRLALSVAAASVLAKTARDEWMCAQEPLFPGYGFAAHKGYGTLAHRAAVARLGLCAIHRRSFTIPPP